jgi:hypothetical protein
MHGPTNVKVITRFVLLDYHKSYYVRGIREFSFGRGCSVCWFERGDVWTNLQRISVSTHSRLPTQHGRDWQVSTLRSAELGMKEPWLPS